MQLLVKMKKLINYIPTGLFSVLATVLVAYILLSPPSAVSTRWFHLFDFKYGDKVEHMLLFMFLCFAYLYDYTKFRNPHHTHINKELAFTVLASAIGLLTETGQLAMGLGRTFEVTDIVADVVGAFITFVFMHFSGSHLLRKYLFSVRRRYGRKKGKNHRHQSKAHYHRHHHVTEAS